MNLTLRWSLGAALALSIAALCVPDGRESGVTPAVERSLVPGSMAAAPLPSSNQGLLVPDRLDKRPLPSSAGDPFSGISPLELPKTKPLVGPIFEQPPARPQPPALTYRYVGQMTSPDGERWVYLSRADKEIRAMVGTRLDEGYVVQAVSSDGVRLYHGASNATAVIPIPPTQETDAGR